MDRETPNAQAHALEHIANVLGLASASAGIDEGLRRRIHLELSRAPELETATRDTWGNWDFPYSPSNLDGQLYVPWLDQALLAACGGPLQERPAAGFKSPWPQDKRFALCLTHDMDFITLHPSIPDCLRMVSRNVGLLLERPRDRAHVPDMIRNIVRAGYLLASLRGLRPSHERTYEEWLKLEDKHGFKSTFHFFPETVSLPHVYDCLYAYDDPVRFDGRAMRVRDMMLEIHRSGWEIGLHGSYHSATRPGLLADQKRQVEQAIQQPVISTRQHWLRYDVRTTPRLQSQAGLLADSTHGFNRNIGFRAGTAFPYACWDFESARQFPLLQIPQHIMDGALFTTNALQLDVDLAVRHCVRLMDAVERVGGCLTLSWHPNALQYPDYWATYELVLAEAARRGAWGCTMGEMYRWWTARSARIASGAVADDEPGAREPA